VHVKTVLLVQHVLLQYRLPLLECLRERLAAGGVRLRVVHGAASGDLKLQRDEGTLPWTEQLPTRGVPGTGGRGLWMPITGAREDADLVIVPEMAGWLPTYELLARRRRGRFLVACWGHGPGPDDHAQYAATRAIRLRLARSFDWWFSYTEGTTRRLLQAGVPGSQVTTLNNTVDVVGLRRLMDPRDGGRDRARADANLQGPTALYLGALRADKRIDVLLEAAAEIAQRVAGFTLVVGGDGPLRGHVEAALLDNPWLRYAGPVFGKEKAQFLLSADLMLQPAWLGLVVNDAFAAGLPIVTFDDARHSPEGEYLQHGVQGLRLSGNDPSDFATMTVDLLRDPLRLKAMGAAAWEAGSELTIERMADRFVAGITTALSGGPAQLRRGSL
jgi:L-malate glycosyltransferase